MEQVKKTVNVARYWLLSILFSVCCMIIIGMIWYHVDNNYQPNKNQLTTQESVESYLKNNYDNSFLKLNKNLQYIPTGIFLQSFKFSDSNDVNITGYIWQKFSSDSVTKEQFSMPNFVFPEQIGGINEPKFAYKNHQGDVTTIGWYFDVTLRQEFSYSSYPLDHKTIWIRLWPSHFDRNAVLIPALEDYDSVSPGVSFGLEKDIVIGDWEVNETFFEYKLSDYDTSFGFGPEHIHQSYPELHFNLVLKRKFINAFVIQLVPLLTVGVLLFSLLMTVTSLASKRELLGFNFTGVISIVSALFFVVMLSHIQLREQFSEDGIVYIEYFFLLMYFIMVTIICNTYLFSLGKTKKLRWIHIHDHLIPKLVYWPFLLGIMAIVTYLKFMW